MSTPKTTLDPKSPSYLKTATLQYPPTPESLSSLHFESVDTLESPIEPDHSHWRPSYHVQPANGWLNDPCAPGYDSETGLYHVSFQWNPQGNDWGNISWGHATSPDLTKWTIDPTPTLVPGQPYDHEGIFTGCFHSLQYAKEDSSLLVQFYTSVNALPIHHTLPYTAGCESLSLATSTDNGQTWIKHPDNPIIPSAPPSLEVTGWRDPFVSKWETMSNALGKSTNTLYGLISGGIVGTTPTTFLYSIDPTELTNWTYLGPLVNFGLNKRPSRWSGDLGLNWEVTNFLTLHDPLEATTTRDFLIMGAEGCLSPPSPSPIHQQTTPNRPARCQLWMSGAIVQTPQHNSPTMTYAFGGHLDHGCFYAANSFFDPISQSHTVWGWITEDDLSDRLRHRQGWSGMLSLPRRVRIQTITGVCKALSSELASITSIEAVPDAYGTFTVRTLSSIPETRVVHNLRRRRGVSMTSMAERCISTVHADLLMDDTKSTAWEMGCQIDLSSTCKSVGIRIGHSDDFSKSTILRFDPQSETILVERPTFDDAQEQSEINSGNEEAPHTLFTSRDPSTGKEVQEKLEIRIWRDASVLEIFINERTAITTRIFAGDDTFGFRFFAFDGEMLDSIVGVAGTSVCDASVWNGIGVE